MASASGALARPGTQKISATAGGFAGTLDNGDEFGTSVAALGDLDGDSVGDLVVGARGDEDGGFSNNCAVWVLFMNADGTVKAHQKIRATAGGFTGSLDNGDEFGSSVAALGDVDGDSVGDLAVGAPGDDDGGSDRGAVWVLFLNADGTVKAHDKISATAGGFAGALDDGDSFGSSVAALGDSDGDGVGDLAVGAPGNDDGGFFNSGAVWIVFADGALTCPADINGDGVVDVLDLIELLFCVYTDPPDAPCLSTDINQDGVSNVYDLIDLLLAFGTTCP